MSFQSVSNSVYSNKYQLFDKHGNEVDESRSHSFMRVAQALAKNEKDCRYWTDVFFEAMVSGAIPAGRIMSNAGAEEHKPNTSQINCVVADTIYDSIESIGQSVKDSLITLSGGSGIGYDFSSLRPKGSFVNGVGSTTSGPLPFADIFDKGCFTIASAGGRRGAQMATFDLRHPDVLAFIKAKRENGRFRQFNISVLVPHSFFNEEKDWIFRFPIRSSDPALDTAETMWDTWHIKDAAYITNEHGQTLFKIYGKMPKSELWNLILQSNYEYAEPGVIFIDRVNEENNLWFCEEIRASNPSMPAGTLVHTNLGILPIEELENQLFSVRSLDGCWAPASCRLSGEAETLMEINFGNYKTIQATPKHLWPVLNSFGKIVKKETSELKAGDLIPLNLNLPLEFNVDPTLTEDEGFLVGVFMGNGWLSSRVDGTGYAFGISFNKLDIKVAERTLSILNQYKNNPSSIKENAHELSIQLTSKAFIEWFMLRFGIFPKTKDLPLVLFKSNDYFIRGFIDGLFSTDGSISEGNDFRGGCIIFSQKSESFTMNLAKLLSFYGIKTSVWKTESSNTVFPNGKSYNKSYTAFAVKLANSASKAFASLFNLTCERKQAKLDFLVLRKPKKSKITNLYNEVKTVTYVQGAHKVWDISVQHDQHVFPTEWGYTGNCGEQMLPPNNSCLLGSIDLTQFVEQPFTDDAHFDFSNFSNTVDVFTRMLDNVVEFNNLPLKSQQDEILQKRRHGMGFFGLGSALIMLCIHYDSKTALDFAEKVTKLMAIRGYVTGCALAEEKGCAPVLNEYFEITPEIVRKNELFKDQLGQKVKGIELFLASPYMQRLLADEPELKDRLLRHGCRFSHHTSIAPTGTISLAFGNGASGGIEPSFSHCYFRNLTVQDKKTRQQEAVYSKEFLLYKELYGQNKTDEELLKHLPDYFVTADTISWKAHIDMVAVVQKWVDSSISKTCNVPTNITLEEFKGIYDYAYKVGCKAVSTFRYNPETLGSILSRSEDLANSRYEFKLADGTVIQCAGGDRVEYDGEITTAENLFSALKENTYGKF